MSEEPIVRVAIAAPLHALFDYSPPLESSSVQMVPGMRVEVPFGRSKRIGVVLEVGCESKFSDLKRISAVLDDTPILSPVDLALLSWCARYYQHPIGEVVATALPVRLRKGKAFSLGRSLIWQITDLGRQQWPLLSGNAARQKAILERLAQESLFDAALVEHFPGARPVLKRLLSKGWVVREERTPKNSLLDKDQHGESHCLTDEQQQAVSAVESHGQQFGCFLLDGVTGSGKTEVYLTLIKRALADGGQALLLVPEIGLTPQLMGHLQARFSTRLGLLHSGMSDVEREKVWHGLRLGEISLLLGTRSALFTPMPDLALIIVDEEHDLSFKQQEGFRYSARDVAIRRAQQVGCPIVLGSATPSLESLHNALHGRYQHLKLTQRAGGAKAPRLDLLDVQSTRLEAGLSPVLLKMIQAEVDAGNQVLLFLNRRGYAPVLTCHDCGWVAQCRRCDARMTLHASSNSLWCHHCGSQRRRDEICPECQEDDIRALGQGTEQLEEVLKQYFERYGVVRIDRDTTRRKGELERQLQEIHEGRYKILLGTQMLAKGHHFPDVTLVGILNVDQGLFGADFRAAERMGQQIIQVAGRAGRALKPGRVVIQTRHADHPSLQLLSTQGYGPFAQELLSERKDAQFPPFAFQALLRAEAAKAEFPRQFLEEALERAAQYQLEGVECWGPVPAPMERRAGRFRSHLLLQASSRAELHRLLPVWVSQLAKLKSAKKVRWSIDVDPQEMY